MNDSHVGALQPLFQRGGRGGLYFQDRPKMAFVPEPAQTLVSIKATSFILDGEAVAVEVRTRSGILAKTNLEGAPGEVQIKRGRVRPS